MAAGQPGPRRRFSAGQIAAAVLVIALLAWATRPWWAAARTSGDGASAQTDADDAAHDETHHDHDHATGVSIKLSEKGLKNIGFEPLTVALDSFEQTISLPAKVVECAGETQTQISSPLGGLLTNIFVIQGEAVSPGTKMFEVRLTHEEVVAAQQEYLKTAESLDVIDHEIARLQSLGEGVIAGKRIIEQKYEQQKLQAALRAAEQALLLHGLTADQVAEVLKNRKLLESLTVYAPNYLHAGVDREGDHTFHVQRLPVSPGQQIETNQELAVLADHCELYIEGQAFEDDSAQLREAAREGSNISARIVGAGRSKAEIKELKLLYLADTIDPESRAFHFYLRLPNEVASEQSVGSDRFIDWKFKPGQRLELRVPVERWTERIVLPVEAVVVEGAESYVYRQNGDAFERVAVHVEYRDGRSAVIAKDGALFPGDVVAGRGAYQMHLAAKNQAGGAIDPHAGHTH